MTKPISKATDIKEILGREEAAPRSILHGGCPRNTQGYGTSDAKNLRKLLSDPFDFSWM